MIPVQHLENHEYICLFSGPVACSEFPGLSLLLHQFILTTMGAPDELPPGSSETDTIVSSSQPTNRSPMDLISEAESLNLRRIATNQSKAQRRPGSAAVPSHDNPPNDDLEDATLDPSSASFSLEKWLRAAVSDASQHGLSTPSGGILFRNLTVSGSGSALQLQPTVGSVLTAPLRIASLLRHRRVEPRRILHGFDGVMKTGELLLVLGRPGAGCSTFLKTVCGETNGLHIDADSVLHYNGIPPDQTAVTGS